jgi:two-component system sensor histidine kinase FlrB
MIAEPDSAAAKELQDAFQAFNAVGARLASSYQALQLRVASLTRELAQAHDERLRQLAEKERMAQRLQALIEALPGGVLVVDDEGVIREVNQEAEALLGRGLEGRQWEAVAAEAFRPGGEVLELADGRCLSLSSRALGNGEGRVILLSDITEVRRLQQLATQRQRLAELGEVSARMAHQVRTPLASLLLHLSQLDSPRLAPDGRRQVVERARERVRHLEHLVNNMLAYARGGQGASGPFGLHWLLEQFRQVMAPELSARGGRLVVEVEDVEVELSGDGDALLGALANLGTNAVQACEGPPELKLTVRRQADWLELVLEDNGSGIPEPVRSSLFDPFVTTRPNGTGLGLAVARAVAESFGGTLTLENRKAGGARALLRLPLQPGGTAMPSGIPYAAANRESRKEKNP